MENKKIILGCFLGFLIIGLAFSSGCIESKSSGPVCYEEQEWIIVAEKDCNYDPRCACREKNFFGECVKCTCAVTNTVCN